MRHGRQQQRLDIGGRKAHTQGALGMGLAPEDVLPEPHHAHGRQQAHKEAHAGNQILAAAKVTCSSPSLPTKPLVGGKPASEKAATKKSTASTGFW